MYPIRLPYKGNTVPRLEALEKVKQFLGPMPSGVQMHAYDEDRDEVVYCDDPECHVVACRAYRKKTEDEERRAEKESARVNKEINTCISVLQNASQHTYQEFKEAKDCLTGHGMDVAALIAQMDAKAEQDEKAHNSGGVVSLASRRATTSQDAAAWSALDCLKDMVDDIESGRMATPEHLVIIYTQDGTEDGMGHSLSTDNRLIAAGMVQAYQHTLLAPAYVEDASA